MKNSERPSPEQMLERVRMEDIKGHNKSTGGTLRLFFGYAAGVGKTYAMLQAAQTLKAEGKDIVLGYVEPHARPETEALTRGIEALPTMEWKSQDAIWKEFDLDAALQRKPQYILVDELAHTNHGNCRHRKRWQDVLELLDSGIDVLSTLNVQHVESLNDVIADITGVQVRETVPDRIIQRADEVTLIDISPDELLDRLKQGKIYLPQQAAVALDRFFKRTNLVALREIALRHTADRVHEDVELARRAFDSSNPWPTTERVLVCVSSSPSSANLIRSAKRLADRINAPWLALHVEIQGQQNSANVEIKRLNENLKLAESLGGEVVFTNGDDLVQSILSYAARRNVTKIVVGKTGDRRYSSPSAMNNRMLSRLVQLSGNIDLILVHGREDSVSKVEAVPNKLKRFAINRWIDAIAIVTLATGLTLGMSVSGFTEANIVMVFLLAVVGVAARCGAVPSIAASIASVLLFDLLYTKPFYRLSVEDSQYVVTFTVLLIVGLLASTLTYRIRNQAEIARRNERRTESLYRLSKQLTRCSKILDVVEESERAVSEVFDSHVIIYLPDESRKVRPVLGHLGSFAASDKEFATAQWVLDHGEPAGAGTATLPANKGLFLPLTTPDGVVAVLAIQPKNWAGFDSLESKRLLNMYVSQIAFAIARIRLVDKSKNAAIEIETEKLRSSILSSISHDLRTPLAAINGAATSLKGIHDRSGKESEDESLVDSIIDESTRLNRLVENLLDMTRLSSGPVKLAPQWIPLIELIGSATHRLESQLKGRAVDVDIQPELMLVFGDPLLLETVLVNLMENAIKYSSPNTPISVKGYESSHWSTIEIADRGCGILPGDEERIFESFNRSIWGPTDRRGTGLGLAICRTILHAHNGKIIAKNRETAGAVFVAMLPVIGSPPDIHCDDRNSEI